MLTYLCFLNYLKSHNQTLTNFSRTAGGVSLFHSRRERNTPSTLTPLRCIGGIMSQNNCDGTLNGQDENRHDGLTLKLSPFLQTQASLPQQIDPSELLHGLLPRVAAFLSSLLVACFQNSNSLISILARSVRP